MSNDLRTWLLIINLLCSLGSMTFAVLTLRDSLRMRAKLRRQDEANQRLRTAIRMDGAPAAPCAGCTPCWSGCKCHCHRDRIAYVTRQFDEALKS